MATNIEITFSSLPAVDTVLSITDSYTGLTYSETFKTSRTAIGQCAIGSFVSETAQNYQNAFNNDYNASLLYTTQLIVFPIAKLIITAVNPNTQFSIASNTTSGAVTTSIDNVTPPTVFDITEVLINPASIGTVCDDVEFSVETNVQSGKILFPIDQSVSTNPFVFEYPRVGNITIEMQEEAVQNLILWSEQQDNAIWTKSDLSVASDVGNSFKLIPNTASSKKILFQDVVKNYGPETYTYSVKAKKDELKFIYISVGASDSRRAFAGFNLDNGQVVGTGQFGFTLDDYDITPLADNYYQLYVTVTTTGSYQNVAPQTYVYSNSNSITWASNGTDGILIKEVMFNVGTYLDYVKTESTNAPANVSTALRKFRIPKLLSSYIDIQLVNTPNSASVTAVRLSPLTDNETPSAIFPLTFQYAIFGLGGNLVTNGDFENGSADWSVGSGWSIADEKATSNGTTSNLDQNGTFLSGNTYKVTYDVLDYVSGDIRFRFTGTSNENGTLRTANGTYTEYITLTNNQSVFRFPSSAFEGSIDNVSVQEVDVELYPYQNSNSWSGIPVGEYSLGVKDNLGCEIFIPFTIDAFTPNLVDYDAVLEVSKVNSLQFKENEAWANCGIRKNITNTLSYEEDVKINNRAYKQLFQQCDTIRTQIKSNYTTNEAKLVNCDGVETTITITKATENLNITDVRDGTIFIKFGNQISVQFLAGNTYDPITLAQNGSYNLNGDLMQWINIGDYINIEGAGWCYITTILPPSQVSDAYTVVTTTLNNGLFTDLDVVKITSVYNAVDYDRYEFDIDMNALIGDYYVKLNMSHSTFGNKEYISEWFNVATEQECHHLIDYYNTKNNEINYATGITFRLRIPYIKNLKWQPEIDENEIYVTDTRTVLLESRIREAYEITFMPLPTAMAQKLVLALSHDKLQIDGLNYIKNDEPEVEPYGTTNLYSVKCIIVRSDYVFDNTGGTTAGEVILGAGQTFEIDGNASGLLYIN